MAVSQAYTILWGTSVVFVILPHLNLGLLSDYKICGDPECESLMSRVQAIRDHRGKDCRFLSFRRGDTIFVYHKLTGKREDLWAGSIDKQFGYFPKDAVQEEQVYATMEKAVETQKSDFFCMDDFGYPIDSSHLDSDDEDDDDDDQEVQNQGSETTQTTPYTDNSNAEMPSTYEDPSTESTVSAQEADATSAEEDGNKNAGDALEEALETPLNEQGGSASSSWLGSSVTGWLGLTKEEEAGNVAKEENKYEEKAMQVEASVASSVTGWLGLGGGGQPDDAVTSREDDRETADSFTSTMTGWLGFGGEKKTDHSTEKEQDEEREYEESAEKFRSRRMSLDLEGSQLHKEEKKEMGTLDWLGNGLSSTLGFGLTNQESGHETTPERDGKETIQGEEGLPPSGSWLDMGIRDILGFKKDKNEGDESTGSSFKGTEEDKNLEELIGSEDVDISQSQPALTEDLRTETGDETPKDRNTDSPNNATPDSNKDSVLPEAAEASKVDLKNTSPQTELAETSQAVGGMSSVLNSSKEDNVSDDHKRQTNYTDVDFSAQSDINFGPDFSSEGEVEEDKAEEVDEEGAEVLNQINNNMIKIARSHEGEGNNAETDVPITDEDDTSAAYSVETNSDSPAVIENDTETETQQGELGHQGEGSSQESGAAHSTNRGTDITYEKASEEDRRPFSTSESTTQMGNSADEDSGFQQGATQSDGDAHEIKETEKDSNKMNLQPVQTETEKHIVNESGLKSAIGSETETKEVEESKNEEKQVEIEELKEEEKQEEEGDIKEDGEQELKEDIEEIKEEKEQQGELKEEEKQEEEEEDIKEDGEQELKDEMEGIKEEKEQQEELKEKERQEEVNEIKEDEIKEIKEKEQEEELKEEEKHEKVNELKEEEIKDEMEEITEEKEQQEELKEKERQEEVNELKEGEIKDEMKEIKEEKEQQGELKEEERQEEVDELKEEEIKDKMEEIKEKEQELKEEEIKDEMEEIKEKEQEEKFKEEEIKDEMEEIKEEKEQQKELKKKEKQEDVKELNEEGIQEDVKELKEEIDELKEENSLLSSESNEKETRDESSSESVFSKLSTQTQKRQTENPQMEEEKRDEEDKKQEEVKDEMKQEVEEKQQMKNVEAERKNKEVDGSLNKCSNELCPQAGEDRLVRDREGHDSVDRLSSIHEETGKQKAVDDDEVLADRTGGGQRAPAEGMERDVGDIQEEEKDKGGTEGGREVSVTSRVEISEQIVLSDGDNKGTAQTGSGGAFNLFKNAFSFFRSPITQTEASPESATSLDSNTGETFKDSLPPEQELDPTTDSSQVYVLTDSPVTLSQTSSPSPTQTHSDTNHLTKHYQNLLVHMSVDESTVLTELFGQRKLQFLDYILGSSEASTHDPNSDESILLDTERLMHYHRETLVAPSMMLADAPQEDKERTRALIALQKLEMLLGRVRETFNTAEAGCVGESCSAHSEDQGTDTEEDSSAGNNNPRDEWMEVDKETNRVTEDDRKGGKEKRSEEEERASSESRPHIDPGSPQPPEGVVKQILDFVHQMAEESTPHVHAVRELLIWLTVQVVSSLPDDIRPGPDLYGVPWEPVIFSSVVGLVTVLLFTCRCYSSVKSRMYRSKERWMAEQVAQLLDEKCKVLETLSKCQQEYDELENSLRDSGVLAQTQKTEQLEVKARQLGHAKREMDRDLEQLKDQLGQQKEHRIEQERRIAVLEESMKTFEEETKDLQSQEEQAQTTLKVYNMNCDRLQRNLETAGEENALLQESNAQLRQQVEGWAERVSELEAEMSRCEVAHSGMLQDVANKDERIMSLTDRLLRIKAWDSDLEEEGGEEGGEKETSNGTAGRAEANGRGVIMDTQGHLQKVQKLIYAAKLNADLKSVDEDKDRLFAKLNDEVKAKEDLQVSIKELDNEKLSLQSDTEQYTDQVQRLQQKLQIMTEMYQENELKLHRLLTVEEKERMQKEEKLNKADKNIALAMEELNNYRQRAGEMEEEMEKTKQSYQTQISAHEKKAHNNWLAARAAERELADIRRENALFRQKLTDTQFKLDTLDKDPYALDSLARPMPFRAERSPYGPSPLGRPSSETRAFLSPPTLTDGPPARLSPRVSRGPMEPPGGQGEMERSGGPHSDSGSISPTWERDRRGPPPGPPGPSGPLGPLGPPGYMFPEPGGPIYRRPPPGALGHLPPPGPLPPGPLHPRGLPPGPPHPADMADGSYRENNLGPSEQELRESGPGDRRTPPEADPRMGGTPSMGPMGPMDNPFPRRAPYGPPPPDFYPSRGPGGPPMMRMWAPPPPGMMFPPRFLPGGPPLPPHYSPPMRPPLPDGHSHPPMGPPQQSLPFAPHSQSPEEHIPSPEDAI